MKVLAASAILLLAVTSALASSFSVGVLQVNPPCKPNSDACGSSFIPMDVNGNPLIQESFREPVRILEFAIFPPVFGTFTFSATMTLAGQTYDPAAGTVVCDISNGPNCNVGIGWAVPYFSKAVNGEISVSVDGSAFETFNFRYLPQPVPEPATLCLLGTGIAAAGWRKYRLSR